MGFHQTTLGQEVDFFNGKVIKPGLDGQYPAYGSNGVIGRSAEWKYSNAIVIGRVGAYCGSVAYCAKPFWASDNTIVAKPRNPKGNVRYFYYLLRQLSLNRYAGGAAQPLVTHTVLKQVPTLIADLATQHRIASILSAYDDLIENNTRRIAILEEMARRIYEEWFVHFRFPGHEHVRMLASELGLIPEGWQAKRLGEVLEHHIGGGWGEETESEEFSVPAYVIRGTDIPDVRVSSLGRSPLRFHKESNFKTRQIRAGDIVFETSGGSKDQPVGRSVQVRSGLLRRSTSPIICASFCRLVRANAEVMLPELLQLHFEMIYANREIMKYQTQSTGITNFKFMVFLDKEIVLVPAPQVQRQFEQAVFPLFSLADTLGLKNTNLRTTRDLLLPKLISGELDVSHLPEPEAMAA